MLGDLPGALLLGFVPTNCDAYTGATNEHAHTDGYTHAQT